MPQLCIHNSVLFFALAILSNVISVRSVRRVCDHERHSVFATNWECERSTKQRFII